MIGVLQPRPRPAHCIGDSAHRLVLTDHTLLQRLLHVQQLGALAFQHLVHGNAGPPRHHLRDVLRRHRLVDEARAFLILDHLQLSFEIGNDAVGEFAGSREVAAALGDLHFLSCSIQPLLQALHVLNRFLLLLPARGERRGLLFQLGEFGVECLQAIPRGLVRFLSQRFALDLELNDPAVEFVQRLGLGIHLHAQAAGRLVHQVDGLVGKEAIRDVAMRQLRRRDDRGIGDAHAVVDFVFLLQAAQDRDSIFDGRLGDEHRLEAPSQCRVLLHMLAVLVESRGAHAMQLTARQRWFQQVGSVHRAFGLARADEGMHLVDEQDDLSLCSDDFRKNRLQPLLELAAEFCAGDQGTHVERHQPLVAQAFRHVAVDDAQRQAFRDGGLADARLPDQHGIVLGAPRQHLNGAADFLVSSNDRVELAGARELGEVTRIFLQCVVLVLRRRRIRDASLPQIRDCLVQPLRRHAGVFQNARGVCALRHRKGEQQILGSDVRVACLFGGLLCGIEQTSRFGCEIHLPGAGTFDLRNLRDRDFVFAAHLIGTAASGADQSRGETFLIVDQHLEEMLRQQLLIVGTESEGLRRLNEAARPLGKLFNIHAGPLEHARANLRRRFVPTPLGLGVTPGQAPHLVHMCGLEVAAQGAQAAAYATRRRPGRRLGPARFR